MKDRQETMGSEDDQTGQEDQTDDGEESTSGGETGRTFTQADLDRIAARERKAGANAARRQLADDLGISVDEAKALIDETRKRAEAEQSEVDKAKAAAAAAQREAEVARSEARRATAEAKLTTELLRSDGDDKPGLRPERVRQALSLVLADVAAADDIDDAIADAVTKLRADVPEFFSGASAGSNNGNGNGTGTNPGTGRKTSERTGATGSRDRARERFEAIQEARKSSSPMLPPRP